ncbi:MAG: NAD(P)-dependent oxidoreductase [Chlamydiae bacterium]|nr:NAD(P)-dependent oxidoreductase [Chlamydiota bacterium]
MSDTKEVILITGCSGRIGFKAAELFSKKYQVVGFDVIMAGELPGVEMVTVDMSSDASVREGLDYVRKKYGNRLVSVVHLAAYYSFIGGGWGLYQRITVDGTKRLLEGIRKDFVCDQFIFSSTMLVHEPCRPGEKITEDWPVVPKWQYPKSKVLVEKLMHEMKGNMQVLSLRIAGVYDDKCHSIPLSNQIQRIYENQLEGHVFAGDLTHGASFVHMDDVIDSLALAVEKRRQLPQDLTLLIGEEETLSYDELQRTFSKLIHGKEWKTWALPKPIAKIGAVVKQWIPFIPKTFIKPWMIDLADDHYELDITRAKKMLGWIPKRSLRATIPMWIADLKREPVAWYDENKLKISPQVAKQKS